jgi:hypothetical protein
MAMLIAILLLDAGKLLCRGGRGAPSLRNGGGLLETCGGGYAGNVADHIHHGFGFEARLAVRVCGWDDVEEEVDFAGERRRACDDGRVAGGHEVAARGVETAAGCAFEGG